MSETKATIRTDWWWCETHSHRAYARDVTCFVGGATPCRIVGRILVDTSDIGSNQEPSHD
jgi:hypothetical protein